MNLDISLLRHDKEKLYGTVALVVGLLIWLGLLLSTLGSILLFLIPLGIFLFVAERVARVVLFGDAVQVTDRQLPEINSLVRQCAAEMGLDAVPTVFVVSSNGLINAMAIRFLRTRYVLLFSHLVDVLPPAELAMIIGHELAHHRAGHTGFWRNLGMAPSFMVPFLGAAYSRARELTADRIAAAWLGNPDASKAALVALAAGSGRFAGQVNVAAFREQEALVPPIFGFLIAIFATHPRLTRRVIALDEYFHERIAPAAAQPALA